MQQRRIVSVVQTIEVLRYRAVDEHTLMKKAGYGYDASKNV